MSPQRRTLSEAERLDWLRLVRTENVGPITFFQLLHHLGSAAAALESLPELARRGGRRQPIRVLSRAAAEREYAAATAAGARFVAWGEADYPESLAAIADPPPVLTVKGHGHLLVARILAIVGARNASANGIRFTRKIAQNLGEQGLVIASGLARGIDTAAHEGALATGTVAVMAGGIDGCYPLENEALYDRIVESGVLISEIAFGTQPQARHFPRRNRLVSGLSLGILVVEAASRSGSLITARFALEQGREVFAVPGSPLDPRARGTNNLLRQGATLVSGAEDVVAVLDAMRPPRITEPPDRPFAAAPMVPPDQAEMERGRGTIRDLLSPTPVEVDELLRQSQLTPAVIITILLELELAGLLQRHPGNQVSLVENGG